MKAFLFLPSISSVFIDYFWYFILADYFLVFHPFPDINNYSLFRFYNFLILHYSGLVL